MKVAQLVLLASGWACTCCALAVGTSAPASHWSHARAIGSRLPSTAVLCSAATVTDGGDGGHGGSSVGVGVDGRGSRKTAAARSQLRVPAAAKRRARPPVKNWRVVKLYREAQGCIGAGEYDRARDLLERCLELDSGDAYCWLSLARLEARSGRTDHARRLFDEVRARPD